MDERFYLIFTLNKKTNEWSDKTRQIKSIVPYSNGYKVGFDNGARIYSYPHTKIRVHDDPVSINQDEIKVFIDNKLVSQSADIIKFAGYICIYEGKNKRRYKTENVQFVRNIAHSEATCKVKDYFSKIAELKQEQPASKHLHFYYSKKLNVVSDESFAAKFVDSSTPSAFENLDPLIFPFGINLSQRKALQEALENQLSLVQGPPGTGKTQTILNLIANLIIRNKTIAVAAGNNAAVANVYEKLEKSGLGFLVASLGSNDNVEAFFQKLAEKPDMSEWALTSDLKDKLHKDLSNLDRHISKLLKIKNMLASKRTFLDRLELEKRYFHNSFDSPPLQIEKYSLSKKWQTPELLRFMADFEHYSQFEVLKWRTKFAWFLKYRIYKFKTFYDFDEGVFKQLISAFYQRKIDETVKLIDGLEEKLNNANFDELLQRQTKQSMRLFKAFLAEKYALEVLESIDHKNYKKSQYDTFVQQYPVTLSTTDSLLSNKPSCHLFDYLIVDEASQVNLITGFLSMCCARKMVVVGDMKQLPHIANDDLPIDIEHQFGFESPYDFKRNNLLGSLIKLFPESPSTLLKEHYRCHPRIIEFCNQKYYNGELVIMTEGGGEPFKIIQTEKGNHAITPPSKKGKINRRELDVIKNEALPFELEKTSSKDIGVVTPYRAQANMCNKDMKTIGVDVDTVHKFQGREKDTIIFSTTANRINRHIDQAELVNVTVSRAKNKFVVVSSESLVKQHGTNVGDLMRYIEYQSESPVITRSSTVSIFDCLYKEYSLTLNEFRNRVKRSSQYLSQDLMSTLIDDQLQSGGYGALAYNKDYPLHLLVNKFEGFSMEEIKFIKSTTSHVDFLFYNPMDMLAVIALEVDGYHFHDMNPKQLERDAIKDSIFHKMNIPLYRFSTKGSGEKDRLIEILSPFNNKFSEK